MTKKNISNGASQYAENSAKHCAENNDGKNGKLLVGWREWVSLPDLGIVSMKAKIDTGARTSCLHTKNIEEYQKNGEKWVKFITYPTPNDSTASQECHAKVVDMRTVRDSGGHESFRYVIETTFTIGALTYLIEMTLTARDKMKFKMLVGRTAMEGRLIVDPDASFLVPAPKD